MKKFRIAPEIRDQVIARIKNEGITVAQAAKDHGISETTVYKLLGSSAAGPSYAEMAKLQRDVAGTRLIMANRQRRGLDAFSQRIL
jgi:transposase-like protein